MRNNATRGSLAIALTATVDHRRLLVASMILSMLIALLIDALIAIVLHRHSIGIMAGSVGLNESIAMAVLLYWMTGQAQKTA